MKKLVFSATFFLAFCMISHAQSLYASRDHSNFSLAVDEPSNSILNITVDAGTGIVPDPDGYFIKSGAGFIFNIGKHYQVGPGFGIRYYNYTNGRRERTRMAFYLDNRIFFTKKDVKPYIRLIGGYGKDWDYDITSGFFGSGSLGVWIGANNDVPVYLELGGDFDDLGTFRDIGAITFTIGIAFSGGQ